GLTDNTAYTGIFATHRNSSTAVTYSFDDFSISSPITDINPTEIITRGPYLNAASQNSIVIRWRTNVPTASIVKIGTFVNNLNKTYADTLLKTEHEIKFSGLSAGTKYFYSLSTSQKKLQGDSNNYFKTLPPKDNLEKIKVLAMGDMGNNSTNQKKVRDAYLKYMGGKNSDVWILLGDNAYSSGLDSEYQNNFFNIYQDNLTKNHVLWPAPGNHDYKYSSTAQKDHKMPYYDIFSLPVNGEAGGVASNNEAFYSYDYGNVHFVSLDSYGMESGSTRLYDTTGAQVTWLKKDLAANKQKWTVVYFHHPPYTKGSHDSDIETELIRLRQNLVKILERYNVDLVLNGHSHSYERSYLLKGHYDIESTFNHEIHALSSSSGKNDGTSNSCPYVKNSGDTANGIVFAVVGSSGRVGGSSLGYPHDAMYYSNVTTGGAMVLEIENNRLDAKWIGSDGLIRDNFTILKDVENDCKESLSYSRPSENLNYQDDKSNLHFSIKAVPNPFNSQTQLKIITSSPGEVDIKIYDVYGRIIFVDRGNPNQQYTLGKDIPTGIYYVHVKQGAQTQVIKILKQNQR
ncbi:MAG: metallophosphoesterase, partial [Chitinophagaceae bacterium]